MDATAARRLLAAATPDVDDLERPHVVVKLDPALGNLSAIGPFADAVSAWRAVIQMQADFDQLGDGLPPIIAVAACLDDPAPYLVDPQGDDRAEFGSPRVAGPNSPATRV